MRFRRLITLLVTVVLTIARPTYAQNIDTRGTSAAVVVGWDVFGQTFTAPTPDAILTSFSFWIGSETPYNYRALLYAFNGTAPAGSALFTSALMSAGGVLNSADPSFADLERVTFSTPDIVLTPGSVYMALLQRADAGGLIVGFALNPGPSSTYSGGAAYGIQTAAGVDAATSDPTTGHYLTNLVGGAGADFAFTATFSETLTATPEPASFALMATGLVGVAGFAWRRRRRI